MRQDLGNYQPPVMLGAWEIESLQKLREPFPPERIEKLPKPLYKGAWDNERKGHCKVCGGYHVLENTIHLDYVGHANATDRILECDLWWDWEPLAYTPDGLPLFDRSGGLWIKLTVCGVTRLGYGDGSSVKEVIGDAIRNAAMRFGLALDLWAKINLHEERNPGDGPTQVSRRQEQDQVRGRRGSQGEQAERPVAANQAPNQEALDELASVCDRHGYDRRSCGAMYAEWVSQHDNPGTPRLVDAESDAIRSFARFLIDMAEAEPADLRDATEGDDGDTAEDVRRSAPETGGAADASEPVDGGDDDGAGRPDPTDTSDVEKKPNEAF